VDGFVCKLYIKEDGMSYGIDLWLIAPWYQNPWVDVFPIDGMACETGAVLEAAVCAGEDTWAGIVDPVNVMVGLVLLDGIDCVPPCDYGGLAAVSDAMAAFDVALVWPGGRFQEVVFYFSIAYITQTININQINFKEKKFLRKKHKRSYWACQFVYIDFW